MASGASTTQAKEAERAAREARLAEALRENLARRKEQRRARKPEPSEPRGGGDRPPNPRLEPRKGLG